MATLTEEEKEMRDCDLWSGCASGKIALVRRALELGAQPNFIHDEDGVTAIMEVCIRGHKDILELLLKHGTTVTAGSHIGRKPLMHAASGGRTEMVDLIFKSGQEININETDLHGYTALMLAVEGGHIETVKLLLDNRANVDVEGKERLDPRGRGFISPEETPYTRTALSIARRMVEYQITGQTNFSTILKMLEERSTIGVTPVPLRTDYRNRQRVRTRV